MAKVWELTGTKEVDLMCLSLKKFLKKLQEGVPEEKKRVFLPRLASGVYKAVKDDVL